MRHTAQSLDVLPEPLHRRIDRLLASETWHRTEAARYLVSQRGEASLRQARHNLEAAERFARLLAEITPQETPDG